VLRPGRERRLGAARVLLRLSPALLLLCCGCYSVGVEPVAGLEEIAVPLFENQTLRRGVEHDLTRAVRREVLETTPLQLTREADGARAVLRGVITQIDEQVLLAGPAEEVLEGGLQVTVRFGVYRDQALLVGEDSDGDGAPDGEIQLAGYAEYDTARGESRVSATAEALADLAEMIVFRLTAREDDRFEPNDAPAEAARLGVREQLDLMQRDADWFRWTLPPDTRFVATLYYDGEELALSLHDPDGAPLPSAEQIDGARQVSLPAAADEREVLLQVRGDDRGQRYRLALRLETVTR